jgi:hypothetical protein
VFDSYLFSEICFFEKVHLTGSRICELTKEGVNMKLNISMYNNLIW